MEPPPSPIYLDHCATTPVADEVFAAMRPYFREAFGNAASRSHAFGRRAAEAVALARRQAAALIGADEREIVWTSGSTEGNNLALKGAVAAAAAARDKGRHVITQVTEHKAVIDPCKRLQEEGCEITWLPVDAGGRIDLGELEAAIRPETVLVSVMWANNEIGTVQPIRQVGEICHRRGVLFHTDATQAVGKLPVDVVADGVDLLSFSGHKMYGPKGCGGLYVRRKEPRVRLVPLLDGGGHERGFRSGTLNVPGIVGVGAACELAGREREAETARLAGLRDRLEAGLLGELGESVGARVNGDRLHRLPHVSNLSFAGVDSHSLLQSLDDIALSPGAACNSAGFEGSYVLRAIGLGDEWAFGSVRFSLGRMNDATQVDYAIRRVVEAVRQLRQRGPAASVWAGGGRGGAAGACPR